jgi:hypothetical protein
MAEEKKVPFQPTVVRSKRSERRREEMAQAVKNSQKVSERALPPRNGEPAPPPLTAAPAKSAAKGGK